MLYSDYRALYPVTLPPHKARQMYMHTFELARPVMPAGFEDYLDPVLTLIRIAGANEGIAHMTVDEKILLAGTSQRRPKPHVDGCYVPALKNWSHDGGGGWLHNCNNIAAEKIGRMPVIVAANAIGCRAWRGVFDGEPKNDGDLSHLALGEGEILPANVGYLFSPDCIHESMCAKETLQRTFLRIALPTDFGF